MSFRGHVLITDFTYGEVSPRWQSRVEGGDIATDRGTSARLQDVYESGCRELTNMFVMPEGGAIKRPGFRFAASPDATFDDVDGDGADYRVIRYHNEPSDHIMVFKDFEVTVFDTSTIPFPASTTVALPYSLAQLIELEFAQTGDTMILIHPSFRPRILNQTAPLVFELEDPVDDFLPPQFDFSDEDSPPVEAVSYDVSFIITKNRFLILDVSGVATSNNTTVISLTDNVQNVAELTSALQTTSTVKRQTIAVEHVGPALDFTISYEFFSSLGNGTGDLSIGIQNPQETEEAIVTKTNEGASGGEPLWSGPIIVSNVGEFFQCDVPHRAETDNEPGVGVDYLNFWTDLGASIPTDQDYSFLGPWEIDRAYSPGDRGWPRLGTFHEQRFLLDGGKALPHALAGSKTGIANILDFTLGTSDADGFLFLLVSEAGKDIRWMISQRFLFIGTTRGTYVQTVSPLTPTSVNFQRESMHSSARERALAVAGEIFHLQGNRRIGRKVQFIRDVSSWTAQDLTIFGEHLFLDGQGIVDWSYVDEPDSLIFVVREDGALLTFTYSDYYKVNAWARHSVSDPVIECEFYDDGVSDRMAILVKRRQWDDVAQQWRFRPQIEVMELTSKNLLAFTPQVFDENTGEPTRSDWDITQLDENDWYVLLDGYSTFTGDGTTTVGTETRFANRTVGVVENGVYLGQVLVDNAGTIVLDAPTIFGSTIYVGFEYTGRTIPNRYQLTVPVTSQSQKIRWTKPVLRLFASHMPLINGVRARERSSDDLYDTQADLFTGDVYLVNYGSDGLLTIEQDVPLPFHMTGIFGLMTTEEG